MSSPTPPITIDRDEKAAKDLLSQYKPTEEAIKSNATPLSSEAETAPQYASYVSMVKIKGMIHQIFFNHNGNLRSAINLMRTWCEQRRYYHLNTSNLFTDIEGEVEKFDMGENY